MKNILFTSLLLLALASTSLMAQTNNDPNSFEKDLPEFLASVDLTQDIDLVFFQIWQTPIFEKLVNSEKRLISVMTGSMKLLKISLNTSVLEGEGTYKNEDLQELYDRLTMAGRASVNEALMASAELEEHQLLFLEKALERTENLDAILLYDQLRMISKKNLRTIAGELLNDGITYRPVVMSDEYFDNHVMSEARPVF